MDGLGFASPIGRQILTLAGVAKALQQVARETFLGVEPDEVTIIKSSAFNSSSLLTLELGLAYESKLVLMDNIDHVYRAEDIAME